PQGLDVLGWIRLDSNDVGVLAWLYAAHVSLHVEQLRRVCRCRLQSLQRRHARLDVQLRLRDRRRGPIVGLEWKLISAQCDVEAEPDGLLQHRPVILARAVYTRY